MPKLSKKTTAAAKPAKAPKPAPRAAKPAKAPKAAPKAAKPKADKPLGKPAQIIANAQAGKLPIPPDFSAATHKPYRARLEALIALVEGRDLKGLKAIEMIPPRSTSPKALHRYRDLAIMALEAGRK